MAAALNRLYCAVLEYSSHILARWCGLFGSGVAGASRVWLQPLWQTGQPTQEDAIAAEMGGEAPPKKKKRRSPCSRRSGKKDRMTDNQRAMHRRRDADGDDGGASSGHFGLGQ